MTCPQTNACNFTKPLGVHNASFPANLVSSVIFLLFSIFLNKTLGKGKQLRYEEFTKAGLTHLLKLKRGKSRVLMSLPRQSRFQVWEETLFRIENPCLLTTQSRLPASMFGTYKR